MRNNRWLWVGVYLVATALLAGGVVFLIQDRDKSSEAATPYLPELATMPFASGLTPVGATNGRVGDSLLFDAQGYTEDEIRSVELWDGDRRIETQAVDGASGAMVTLPALSVGQHAVYAKVTDADGETSLTAPVPVSIVANGSEPVTPVTVVPEEGETVGQLAKRLDIGIDRISILAAGSNLLPPEQVQDLPLVADDVIPVDAIVGAQPDGDAGYEEAVSPDPVVQQGGGSSAGDLAMSAKAAGCEITLTLSGASGDVEVYEAAGSAAGWSRVGKRSGSGTVSIPVVTPGVHLFFAQKVGAKAGDPRTAPLQVTMPPGCTKASGWTGDAFITDGILTVTTGVGGAGQWLYLQADGGTAVRVPATGFLPSVGLYTDIGSLLPPMAGTVLDLELWQGSEFLEKKVASGHLNAPAGSSIGSVIGEGRQLDLKLTDPAGTVAVLDSQDRKLTFTWSAGARIEAVLYQVLVDDQPVTQTTVAPEQVLASGVSIRKSAGSSGSGTFTVDTADIPGRKPTGKDAAAGPTAAYPVSIAEAPGTQITSSKKPSFVTPIGQGSVDRAAEAPVVIDLPTYGDDVYVRAIGIGADGSGIKTASNTVRVQLPVPQGIDGKSVDFVTGSDFGDTLFTPGHPPGRSFPKCVWADVSWPGPIDYGPYLSRSPHGEASRIEAMSAAYPADGTYCPEDFPPPPPPSAESCPIAQIFCDVWSGIKEFGGAVLSVIETVYEFATAVVGTVVDGIATAVAKYTGVCEALETVAEGSKKTCGTVLKMATKAVISALLVSVGVPPVLPDAGILAAVAKGDFAAVAVTLMEVAGIPCSTFKPDPDLATVMDKTAQATTKGSEIVQVAKDPCLAIASALVATVKSQVLPKAQAAIAQSAGLPFQTISSRQYPFSLTPSPLGKNGPTNVLLRMQPREDNAEASGITCFVTVRVVYVPDDGGKPTTVIPGQVIRIDELAAPNEGHWEKEVVLNSKAPNKYFYNGTWRFEATTQGVQQCRLEPITLTGRPKPLPNYAKDRKKGQPTDAAARPNG